MRLFLIVFLVSFNMYAHDYFFAFAEVAYNETSKKIEATLTVSSHDLELAIQKEGYKIEDLAKIEKGSRDFETLEIYIRKHFQIKLDSNAKFDLLGFKISLNGTTDFYFESEVLAIKDRVVVVYDLLMNHFNKQQNKVTFYHKKKSYTRPFLNSKKLQIIQLN